MGTWESGLPVIDGDRDLLVEEAKDAGFKLE